jgi:hypothetical protein
MEASAPGAPAREHRIPMVAKRSDHVTLFTERC